MKKFLLCVRDVFLILLLTLVSMMVGGIWLDSWEINNIALPLHYFFAPIIYLILFLVGFRCIKGKVFHDSFRAVSFPPSFSKRYFGYAFGLLVLCAVGDILVGGKFIFPKIDTYLFAQNIASFLGTFLIAPLIEEIVFRVVILTQIAKRYGIFTGITVSSLLFGAVHLMNGRLDFLSAIQLVLSGTLMGILLSIMYVSEKTVWASFTIHALYNGIGSIIPIVTASETIIPDWPIYFVLRNDNQLITGGQYGIDCSLFHNIAYIIIIIIMLVSLHKKGSSLQKAWENPIHNNI